MTTQSTRNVLLACTAMLVFSPPVARAQEGAVEATVLETIVVKGQRVKAPAGDVADTPLAARTTAEQLRQHDVQEISDLARLDPALDFVRTRPGTSGGLFIRGLGGARITTLIDGIPIPFLQNAARSSTNSPTTTTGDSTDSFDFGSLSAVDVLKGADSSRLGSGGLGGGLSLSTLEPKDLIGEGRHWGALWKSTYDSSDRSIGSSFAVARESGSTSVLLQGAYRRGHETETQGTVGGTSLARTEANPAEFDQNNILLKARQELEGGHRIGVTIERFRREIETDLRTIQGTGSSTLGFYRPDYTGEEATARDRVSVEYDFEAPESGGLIDAASFVTYWQHLEKSAGSSGTRRRTAGPLAGTSYLYERDNAVEEAAFGFTGDAVSRFEVGSLDHELRYGGNASLFGAESFLRAVPTTTASQSDMPDVDGLRLGLYVEDKITFNEGPFSITPGLRFDLYKYDTQLTNEFQNNTGYGVFGLPKDSDGNAISPKVLLAYQATPELELFAQWSMAYRAPTINELYLNFTNGTFYTVIGNPNLEPERANGFEIGANYEGADLDARFVLFHNKYKNFIETYSPNIFGPLDQSWRNIARVDISGVEVSARKEFANGLFLHGALGYAYGEDKDTGEFVRTVAPFRAVAGVGFNALYWGVDISGEFSGGMRDDEDPDTFDAPGHGIFNLTGWWEPFGSQGPRLQAGVYNLFDKKYWNAVAVREVDPVSTGYQPVDYYSEPGRSFKISLTQRF